MKTTKSAAAKLVWILDQTANNPHEVEEYEDEVWITTAEGAVIVVCMGEREAVSILGRDVIPCPVFRLGYMKTIFGGHWEPDDVDFYEVEETPNAYSAAEYAMLYPGRCHVNSVLETISARDQQFEEV